MKVSIWGCRGSIARSNKSLIRYGGNTSCVEVETDTTRIVLDMGSGAYDLGQKLAKLGPLQDQHILLSHTHWDHIQGFPFFVPFFIPGSTWNIYAPGGFSSSLEEKLSSQMSHEFFPLAIDELAANINYHDLREGELDIGDIHIRAQYINHSVLTLGYRLESVETGIKIAYITDHEPYDQSLAIKGYTQPPSSIGMPRSADDRHVDFFRDVDLLIHDSQYLASEYANKRGWGHSTVELVVDMAMAANVKTLVLSHHDPQRTDEQVDQVLMMAQERVQKAGSSMEVIAGEDCSTITFAEEEVEDEDEPEAEPMSLSMSQSSRRRRSSVIERTPFPPPVTIDFVDHDVEDAPSKRVSALTLGSDMASNKEVVICHDNPTAFESLKADGIHVAHETNDDKLLRKLCQRRPSLILIGHSDNQENYECVLKTCQKLRSEGDSEWGQTVPFLVTVPNQSTLERLQSTGEQAGGVTDWIVEPFTQAYIRTRIRMGIARHSLRWVPPVIPNNEEERMMALRALHILDTAPEERFDRITRLCSKVFKVPLVFISLVDSNRQWFKSSTWLCPVPGGGDTPPTETPRDISFCGHAINEEDMLIINDAGSSELFADNPLVADQEGLKIRFYAGCPLRLPNPKYNPEQQSGDGGEEDGETEEEYVNIGTLCLIDQRPRDLDELQKEMLRDFANMVAHEILPATNTSRIQAFEAANAATAAEVKTTAEEKKKRPAAGA